MSTLIPIFAEVDNLASPDLPYCPWPYGDTNPIIVGQKHLICVNATVYVNDMTKTQDSLLRVIRDIRTDVTARVVSAGDSSSSFAS